MSRCPADCSSPLRSRYRSARRGRPGRDTDAQDTTAPAERRSKRASPSSKPRRLICGRWCSTCPAWRCRRAGPSTWCRRPRQAAASTRTPSTRSPAPAPSGQHRGRAAHDHLVRGARELHQRRLPRLHLRRRLRYPGVAVGTPVPPWYAQEAAREFLTALVSCVRAAQGAPCCSRISSAPGCRPARSRDRTLPSGGVRIRDPPGTPADVFKQTGLAADQSKDLL